MKNSQRQHEYDTEFRYLLGLMEPAAREAMQESVLESDDAADRVREAENELFDAWARGDMPPEYRRPFAQRFANDPRYRAKLGFSRAMEKRGAKAAPWPWLAVAAALVAAAGATLWMSRRVQIPETVEVARPVTVATITLPAAGTRGSPQIPVFPLPANATHIDIEAPAPEQRKALYDVDVRTSRDQSIFKASGIAARPPGDRVIVRVAREKLPPGSYELAIESGGAPLAFHYFRIE